MMSPDMMLVDEVAEQLGVTVGVILGACAALGIDATDGVHHSYFESIRQVVLQWNREGRL
ncbi:hypothetical protein [Rhodococcus artemisiae]|uniref:Uncharacterized protein n=1 Tax=Rhodococcus artemisiae TaxID=714159 RepID=A0ABU7LBR2_9NOCA|nr:hypothetical protein [Rhodococcus artemisiae]MEE2058981.1 hypothetical protein [Rhodococcus artemisiae]